MIEGSINRKVVCDICAKKILDGNMAVVVLNSYAVEREICVPCFMERVEAEAPARLEQKDKKK